MKTRVLITADYVSNCDCKSTSEQRAHDCVEAQAYQQIVMRLTVRFSGRLTLGQSFPQGILKAPRFHLPQCNRFHGQSDKPRNHLHQR